MDYDNMTDEELETVYNKLPNSSVSEQTDYANMSDKELEEAYNKLPQTAVTEPATAATPDKPINIDLTPVPQVATEDPNMVQPEDVTATMLTEQTVDEKTNKIIQVNPYEEALENEERADRANALRADFNPMGGNDIANMNFWTDVKGNKHETGDPEGLEDTLLTLIPAGKFAIGLGLKASVPYDEIVSGMMEVGKSAKALEAAANLISKSGKVTKEEVIASVSHLSAEDKVIAIAMGTKNQKFINHIKYAIGNDSILASKLQDEVLTRTDILKALGQNKSELKSAGKLWDDMLEVATKEQVSYPLGNISNSLKYLDDLYGTQMGKAATVVNKLKLASEEGANINLGESLSLRRNLNRLLRNAEKGTDEIGHLNQIKDTIDSFINNVTKNKPELSKLINDTIENYARTTNNFKLSTAMNNAVNDSGRMDYNKLLKTIEKLGLKSPEVTKAVEIAKLFEKKFATDKKLSSIIIPKGSEMGDVGYLGISRVARWIIDNLTPYNRIFNRARFKDIAIQTEIRKSIDKSSSIWKFLENVKANTKLPNEIKESLANTLNKAKQEANSVKQLEHKPGNIPLTATEKGTVSTDISEGILKENQDALLKDLPPKEIDIFHGSKNTFNLKDYNLNKAKEGNLGRGIYVTKSKEAIEKKRDSGFAYDKKRYASINQAKSDGNFKKFTTFKEYNKAMASSGSKNAYNRKLKAAGFDGIEVDTIGHKEQIMLFDTSTIK